MTLKKLHSRLLPVEVCHQGLVVPLRSLGARLPPAEPPEGLCNDRVSRSPPVFTSPPATSACCARAPTPISCSRAPASATANSSGGSTGAPRAPRWTASSAPRPWPRCSTCSTSEGLVEDAGAYDVLTAAERGRYDRQLRYFADLAPDGLTAPECQFGSGASVLVRSAWAAWQLDRDQPRLFRRRRQLTLVDGDDVELSNLNRQARSTRRPTSGGRRRGWRPGRSERFNPGVEVIAVEPTLGTARGVAAGSVQLHRRRRRGSARPRHRALGELRLLPAGRSVRHHEPLPAFARVGPLYVPGETGCFNCQERAYRRQYQTLRPPRRAAPRPALPGGDARPRLRLRGRTGRARRPAPADRPLPAGEQGQVRVFDTRTLELSSEPVPRDPRARSAEGERPAPVTVAP